MESTPKTTDLPRSTLFFILAAAFLVAWSVSIAVIQAYMTGPKVLVPTPSATSKPQSSTRALLWIIVDGLPERIAFSPGMMPNLDRLRDRGAWGVSMAGPVTMTTTCVRTLGTGYYPPLMDDINAFNPEPVRGDNLFVRLRSLHHGGIVFSGDASWTQLFGAWATQTCACPDRGIADTFESDEKADQFARDHINDWLYSSGLLGHDAVVENEGVWVVHFVGSDHVAHRTGTMVEEYRAKVREIDARIGQLIKAVLPSTAILVMADHGATPWGSHGGGEDEARRAPFVIAGPGIRPGGPYETDHRAWPATLGHILGVSPPVRAERGVDWDLVEASDDLHKRCDADFLAMRRQTLLKMGASVDQVAKATTPEELDAVRDTITGPQPLDIAWTITASVVVAIALFALVRAPGTAGTRDGVVMIAVAVLIAAGVQFAMGEWKGFLAVGVLGAGFLAMRLRDVRRSWPLRVGVPWVMGVGLCVAVTWCVCERWVLIGWYRHWGNLWTGAAVLGLCAPLAVFRSRVLKWVGEGGLGLCTLAVGASVPAVWCYWFNHREIYSITAASLLGCWIIGADLRTWIRDPSREWGALHVAVWSGVAAWWRPILPLAGMFIWAKQAADADAVPRFPATTEAAELGVVLLLPIFLQCLRANVWSLLLVAGFLTAGAVQRFTGSDRIVDVMLIAALPVGITSCLLAKEPAARRRFLLLWGLALFRVLAKEHQYVTIALYAWLIDELADSATLSPTPTAVLVGGMAVLDLLQFHLLGSVYTFSTIDVTTAFVGTAKGLDIPRAAALVGLRYAIPLLIVALLPPPPQRNRALALFAVCFLSRCLFLLVCFPWKHVDYWWMCSAPPGVIFTAFQIGLWGLIALPVSLLTRRGP